MKTLKEDIEALDNILKERKVLEKQLRLSRE